MTKLPDQIMNKIKKENIKRTPLWVFEIKNTSLWAINIATTIIGGLAVTIILWSMTHPEFDMLDHESHTQLQHFMSLVPYFWIAVTGLGTTIATITYKKTDTGYKIKTINTVLASVLISICIGLGLFLAGFGERITAEGEYIHSCAVNGCKCQSKTCNQH